MTFTTRLETDQNIELRRKLGDVNTDPTGYAFGAISTIVEKLKAKFPHSLRCLAPKVPRDRRTWDFNCHAFSLRFHAREDFWNARPDVEERLPTGAFLETLISEGRLKPRSPADVSPGDLAVYFDDTEKVRHSGTVVVGDRIQSKWGNLHLWEHALAEVPLEYGSRVKFFEPPEPDVLDFFLCEG